MKTTPFWNIIRKHWLGFHLHGDDTHFIASFQPDVSLSKEAGISRLEACTKDIKIYETNNRLKLNDVKQNLL